MESRPWPFGVTWHHQSRDHLTRGGRLPMGGPLWPCVYLALLSWYEASNVGWTHGRTETQVILYSVQCYAFHWTDNNNSKHNEHKIIHTSSRTFASISSRAVLVFSSRPTIVMMSGLSLDLSGKIIWTSWSVRTLLITAPRRPISFVWCRDATSTSSRNPLSS